MNDECNHGHAQGMHTEDGVGPAVCSVQAEWIIDGREALDRYAARLEKIMCSVGAEVELHGWLVGHIKVHLQAADGEVWLSSVGAGVSRQDSCTAAEIPAGICRVGLTVIAFGPDEGTLYDLVNRLFKKAA